MSDGNKRKRDARDKPRRRYKHDGTPIRMSIEGPGVWVTCIRGKERQAVGELYELFDQVATEMWPAESGQSRAAEGSDEDEDEDEDIEKAIAKEMSGMKRPKKETRFASCQTNTACFIAISCKPPVDPVKLVTRYIADIVESGVTRTRAVQRLTPVATTCITNMQEITSLCTKLLAPFLADGATFRYKIELRMRNHNTLTRPKIIEEVAKCVPTTCKVDLEDPEVFILMEIFKSVCGVSVVRDYYRLQKFNVMEIAKAEEPGFKDDGGRMNAVTGSKSAEPPVPAVIEHET
ncbi:THUMP domain-containing protein [Phanerochaete sordida]|uniref:THUMP domain-containing protein n=1 Tax=Phanerochaete sordida TaxID=48140 RepID=A0A9P3G6Y3_9APHY|nr:THUMP domain-containing protein [Phanerochaete sordida]